MTVKTPTTFRALIASDNRAILNDANSTYTEASPVVGTPTKTSGADSLTLSASAVTITNDEVIDIKAASSGARTSAQFLWKNEVDSDTLFRGHNGPTMIEDWTALTYVDGTGTPVAYSDPHSVTMPNGTVVIAFERQSGVGRDTVTRKYTPSTDTWGSATIVYQTSSATGTGSVMRPTLVVLPSGRLLCFHWVFASGTYNIRMHYSLNSGTSWTLGVEGALNETILLSDHTVGRLRAVWSGQGISMVAELDDNKLRQFYSTDSGASFIRITDQLPISFFHDLHDIDGQLALVYLNQNGTGAGWLRIVGSITEPFKNAEVIEIPTGTWAHSGVGDMASWVDDVGNLAIVGRMVPPTGVNIVIGLWSSSPFKTWQYLGDTSFVPVTGTTDTAGKLIDTGEADVNVRGLNATYAGGRAMLFHSWDAPTSTFDNSIAVATLGGYTTVPLSSQDSGTRFDMTGGFGTVWLPFALPTESGAWTGTGSGTEVLNSGSLELTLGGGSNNRYYSKVPGGAFEDGMLFKATFAVTAGGSVTVARAGFKLTVADGVNDITVEIRASTTGYRVYDVTAGAYVGAVQTVALTSGITLLVHMKDTTISTYHRAATSSEDSEYIAGMSGTLDKTGAGTANLVRFGRLANSGITSMTVTSILHSLGAYTTLPTSTLADKRGNAFPAYVSGGISADQTGIAYATDEHEIPIEHDYALTQALPLSEPLSPRVGWRSVLEPETEIAILISNSISSVTDFGSDFLGIHLQGINWSSGSIQGHNGTTWVTLATVDTSLDYAGLRFERVGNVVRPEGANTNNFWSDHHEWHDSYFKFASEQGACRKITTNASGKWASAASGRRPSFELADILGTEPAAGTGGEIWPSQATILIPLAGVDYSAFRIVIDANQGTAEGYYKIGQIVAGPVVMLADQYSWGRSIENQSGTQLFRTNDRIDYTRTDAPDSRLFQFGWADGVDSTVIGTDYATASSAVGSLPIAAYGDTLMKLEGIFKHSNGPKNAFVYLPTVTRAATPTIITRRQGTIMVRAISNVRRDSVVGEELSTELFRVNSVQLEEIV